MFLRMVCDEATIIQNLSKIYTICSINFISMEFANLKAPISEQAIINLITKTFAAPIPKPFHFLLQVIGLSHHSK